jgi:hypothetical protein
MRGPHRGQNGHFTIRFDTVSSESIQNGTQVNELWVHDTQVSENFFYGMCVTGIFLNGV